MKTMRDKFEKLPEIKKIFDRQDFVFNNHSNQYFIVGFASDSQKVCDVNFIGGAWYAFQEQQKKIDTIKDHMKSFYAEGELWGFDSDRALRQTELIQEILNESQSK